MNRVFEQIRFTVESTKDGSPTLRLPDLGEWMHHSSGAASETLYIYKSVIDLAFKSLESSKTCIVGLGLGYIEISWAMALLEREGVEPEHANLHSLTSFEVIPELKQHFLEWFSTENSLIYDDIIKSYKISDENKILIKSVLSSNYKKEPMQGDLTQFAQNTRWNVICYDAYSSKTSQELWSEEFLNNFLQNHASEDCIFTTYACTGVLKRALAANGFKVIRRPAVQGKGSHCTLALRGEFLKNAELIEKTLQS